jgi:hypothetical protein
MISITANSINNALPKSFSNGVLDVLYQYATFKDFLGRYCVNISAVKRGIGMI